MREIDPTVLRVRETEAAYREACRARDQRIVALSRIEGLSTREVAARVGLSPIAAVVAAAAGADEPADQAGEKGDRERAEDRIAAAEPEPK